MMISLPDPLCKILVPRGFDDPLERQQAVMQETLRQLAPRTLDGGRQVLWRCPVCTQPWFETTASHAICALSPARLAILTRLLGVQQDDLGDLPSALCPPCSTHLIGGVIRVEETISAPQGYRFIWRTEESIAVFQMLIPDTPAHDLAVLKEMLLRQSTDLLPRLAYLSILLRLLHTLPAPSLHELHPFEVQHLTWASERLSALPGQGFVQGAFWHPSVPAVENAPLFAVMHRVRKFTTFDPLRQFAGWHERFASLARAL